MNEERHGFGIVTGLALLVLGIAVISSLALSKLAFVESWDGFSDPAVGTVPNGHLGMFFRTAVHGLLLAYALAVVVGTILRRGWGFHLARWMMPARLALLLALGIAGGAMGLNLFLRLEFSLTTTGVVFAVLSMPFFFFSRQVRDFYRVGAMEKAEEVDGSSPALDDSNPYRRG